MYSLRITDDNSVIGNRCTIMEKSNCVDDIQIIVNKLYKNKLDMSADDIEVYMKYVLPLSHKIKMTKLNTKEINEDEGCIYYTIPAEAYITAEPGDIEVSFTFLKIVANEDETFTSYIRKTQSGILHITPLAQFDTYETNDMFSEIDQRLLALIAAAKDLEALNQKMYDESAKDLRLDEENGKLVLTNKDGDMGDGVEVDGLSDLILKDLVGVDPDGTQYGVTHVDQIPDNVQVYSLDKLLK